MLPFWIRFTAFLAGVAIIGFLCTSTSLLIGIKRCSKQNPWHERARQYYPIFSLLTFNALIPFTVDTFFFGSLLTDNIGLKQAYWDANWSFMSHQVFFFCFYLSYWIGIAFAFFCLKPWFQIPKRKQGLRRSSITTFLLLLPHGTLAFIGLVGIFNSTSVIAHGAWLAFVGVGILLCIFGWNLKLLKALRRVAPAPERIQKLAIDLSKQKGIHLKGIFEIRTSSANAYAFPGLDTLGITTLAIENLSDAEISAVFAHELGHLQESRKVIWFRRFLLFLPFLLLTDYTLYLHEVFSSLIACGIGILILSPIYLTAKWRRNWEEHADHHAKNFEDTYARALEKLYQLNLIPAVIGKKSGTHPDLYDRLLAAGVQPEFSRPAPPPFKRKWVGILAATILAFYLTAQWIEASDPLIDRIVDFILGT